MLNALFRGHHGDKLLIVDLAIAINVGLADHLVDLLVGQLLTQIGHDVAKLGGRDVPIAVLVKYTKGKTGLLSVVSSLNVVYTGRPHEFLLLNQYPSFCAPSW